MQSFIPCGEPPSLGEVLQFDIHDLGFGGEGVGRCREFVIFVAGTIPGETVRAQVTEVKKQFARARLLEILTPSPDRTDPKCRYFGQCGGCQYQHVRYERQLEIKRKQVSDLLVRIGKFPADRVDAVLPCPAPYGYRNRIMVRSQWNKPAQKLDIGFLEAESRLVVDIDRCEIAEPGLNVQLTEVRKNPPPKGGIKVVLRIPPEDWVVPKDSFFQNNFFMLPGLVETVRGRLQDAGSSYLVDAYCGVGFFSLATAECFKSFRGVELDGMAIKAARTNMHNKGITNGEFVQGRSEDLLPSLVQSFPAAETTVILDPPRTGCGPEIIECLRAVAPRQIIYVSCHPATLARDLNILCQGGVFDLRRIVPVDMFPQTQHVECVADIRSMPGAAVGER
ncbi:MAG: class I SAM-dependent RNA methyltransferase [Verrucomicrobiales bacterium]|nr:class I SAM-dependent RNA methyltransferase [Verrucomicrobiales bacterium]